MIEIDTFGPKTPPSTEPKHSEDPYQVDGDPYAIPDDPYRTPTPSEAAEEEINKWQKEQKQGN